MKLKKALLLMVISLLFACKKNDPERSNQTMLLTSIKDDRGVVLEDLKWADGQLIQIDDAQDKYIFTYDSKNRVTSIQVYDQRTGAKRETINQFKFNGDLVEEFVQDQIGNSTGYQIYTLTYLNSKLTKAVTQYYYRSNKQLFDSDTRSFSYGTDGSLSQHTNERGIKTTYVKYDSKKSLLNMLPAWFYLIKDHSMDAFMGVDFQGVLPQNGNLLEASGNGYNHKFTYEYNPQGYPAKITRSSSENNVQYYSDSYTYEYEEK